MVSQCGNRGRWKQQSERVCSLRNDDDDDDEDGDDDDDDVIRMLFKVLHIQYSCSF